MLHFGNAIIYSDGKLLLGEIDIDGVNVSLKGLPLPLGIEGLEHKPLIVPGFVDVHTHLREPGFFYKESIKSGTQSAAAAGCTTVCTMPNLSPVPDCLENLKVQLEIIRRDAVVNVLPYGAITVGEKGEKLSDMEELAPYVCAFSDDGKGVSSPELMCEAMLRAKALGKIIVAHCEDVTLLKKGGCVHDGAYAAAHGLTGISSESEWKQLERDLELVRRTGCTYHVCHVSTKESVQLISRAKAEGLPVTAETAPHYLVLCEDDVKDEGRFKMNPPLRTAADRDALVAALADGTIDCIATDHAPHSDEEKSKGLKDSLFGVVGLECAFPVLYTKLVKSGKITLERLIETMTDAPRKIFGLPPSGGDFAILRLDADETVRGKDMLSRGNATPFEGISVSAVNTITILNGDIIWKRQKES